MKFLLIFRVIPLVWLFLSPWHAHAYIGPGMGLGMAATVLGLFAAFILLLVGLIWLPIRRFIRNRRHHKQVTPSSSDTKQ